MKVRKHKVMQQQAKPVNRYLAMYVNSRKGIITDLWRGRTIPVQIKRDPAALSYSFYDLDFRTGS